MAIKAILELQPAKANSVRSSGLEEWDAGLMQAVPSNNTAVLFTQMAQW